MPWCTVEDDDLTVDPVSDTILLFEDLLLV